MAEQKKSKNIFPSSVCLDGRLGNIDKSGMDALLYGLGGVFRCVCNVLIVSWFRILSFLVSDIAYMATQNRLICLAI